MFAVRQSDFLFGIADEAHDLLTFSVEQRMTREALSAFRELDKDARQAVVLIAIFKSVNVGTLKRIICEALEDLPVKAIFEERPAA